MTAAQVAFTAWQCATRAEETWPAVAGLLLASALERRESRGAHYRSDFPVAAAGAAARSWRVPPASPVVALDAARIRVA